MSLTGSPWSDEERAEVLRIYFAYWDRPPQRVIDAALSSPVFADRLRGSENPRWLLEREFQMLSTVLHELGAEWRHEKPRADGSSEGPRVQYVALLRRAGRLPKGPLPAPRARQSRPTRKAAKPEFVECPNDPGLMIPLEGSCPYCEWQPQGH